MAKISLSNDLGGANAIAGKAFTVTATVTELGEGKTGNVKIEGPNGSNVIVTPAIHEVSANDDFIFTVTIEKIGSTTLTGTLAHDDGDETATQKIKVAPAPIVKKAQINGLSEWPLTWTDVDNELSIELYNIEEADRKDITVNLVKDGTGPGSITTDGPVPVTFSGEIGYAKIKVKITILSEADEIKLLVSANIGAGSDAENIELYVPFFLRNGQTELNAPRIPAADRGIIDDAAIANGVILFASESATGRRFEAGDLITFYTRTGNWIREVKESELGAPIRSYIPEEHLINGSNIIMFSVVAAATGNPSFSRTKIYAVKRESDPAELADLDVVKIFEIDGPNAKNSIINSAVAASGIRYVLTPEFVKFANENATSDTIRIHLVGQDYERKEIKDTAYAIDVERNKISKEFPTQGWLLRRDNVSDPRENERFSQEYFEKIKIGYVNVWGAVVTDEGTHTSRERRSYRVDVQRPGTFIELSEDDDTSANFTVVQNY